MPALLELLKLSKGRTRPGSEKVREKTVELLGRLGSPAAVPAMVELLARRKGFFRDNKEPLPIRSLALQALHAIGGAEAQEAINAALAAEPAGPERDALQTALRQARTQA